MIGFKGKTYHVFNKLASPEEPYFRTEEVRLHETGRASGRTGESSKDRARCLPLQRLSGLRQREVVPPLISKHRLHGSLLPRIRVCL